MNRITHNRAGGRRYVPGPASARRRRRGAVIATVAVTTALAVAAPMAIAGTRRGGTRPPSVAAAWGAIASPLPGGKWTSLPASPIVGRSDGVGIWTGTRLLVWGGTSTTGSRDYADGATYDPVHRKWSVLPASPLSARADVASAWTGTLLYIWGGTNARGATLRDGAAYDPARRHWTTLPAPPIKSDSAAQVYWAGGRLLLLSRPAARNGTHLDLQAYDPTHHRWTVLPRLTLRTGHPGLEFDVVQAGNRLFVWSQWLRTKQIPGGFSGASGIDGYTFDVAARHWARNAFTWTDHDTIAGPMWTGHEILLPASQLWCGYCPGPYNPNSAGSRLDPRSGRARPIPHGPADDLNGQYLWTGSVLVALNTGASSSGGGKSVYPGVAAYWRPSTNRWTLLPHAPLAGAAVSVWTGHSLLLWGEISPTRGVKDGVKNTHGLQLSR